MEWPQRLVRDIAARRSVLFFGSGISMNSISADGQKRPKSWSGFLESALQKIPPPSKSTKREAKKFIEINDLLTACEIIKRAIGRDDFVELVKEEFQEPGYRHAPIHEHLWQLDFRITITPNFDNIYDSLVAQRGNGTVSIKQYFDNDIADSLRGQGRVVIKSHGTVTHPDKLIFSRVDYAKARNEHRDFYGLVDSLLRTHSFIFVGCGLDDPDIRLLLEDYCYRHQYAQSHYFVLPAKRYSAMTKAVLEESLKLKLLEYRATSDHADLTSSLQALVTSVEQKRDELGESQSW